MLRLLVYICLILLPCMGLLTHAQYHCASSSSSVTQRSYTPSITPHRPNLRYLTEHPAKSLHLPGKLPAIDQDQDEAFCLFWSMDGQLLLIKKHQDWLVYNRHQNEVIFRFNQWDQLLSHTELGRHFTHRKLSASQLNPKAIEILESHYDGGFIQKYGLWMIRVHGGLLFSTNIPEIRYFLPVGDSDSSGNIIALSGLLRLNPTDSYDELAVHQEYELYHDIQHSTLRLHVLDHQLNSMSVPKALYTLIDTQHHNPNLILHLNNAISTRGIYFTASDHLFTFNFPDDSPDFLAYDVEQHHYHVIKEEASLVLDAETGFPLFCIRNHWSEHFPHTHLHFIFHRFGHRWMSPQFMTEIQEIFYAPKDLTTRLNLDEYNDSHKTMYSHEHDPLRLIHLEFDPYQLTITLAGKAQYQVQFYRPQPEADFQEVSDDKAIYEACFSQLSPDGKRLMVEEWLRPEHFNGQRPAKRVRCFLRDDDKQWKELPEIPLQEHLHQRIFVSNTGWFLVNADGSVRLIDDQRQTIMTTIPACYSPAPQETLEALLAWEDQHTLPFWHSMILDLEALSQWPWTIMGLSRQPLMVDPLNDRLYRIEWPDTDFANLSLETLRETNTQLRAYRLSTGELYWSTQITDTAFYYDHFKIFSLEGRYLKVGDFIFDAHTGSKLLNLYQGPSPGLMHYEIDRRMNWWSFAPLDNPMHWQYSGFIPSGYGYSIFEPSNERQALDADYQRLMNKAAQHYSFENPDFHITRAHRYTLHSTGTAVMGSLALLILLTWFIFRCFPHKRVWQYLILPLLLIGLGIWMQQLTRTWYHTHLLKPNYEIEVKSADYFMHDPSLQAFGLMEHYYFDNYGDGQSPDIKELKYEVIDREHFRRLPSTPQSHSDFASGDDNHQYPDPSLAYHLDHPYLYASLHRDICILDAQTGEAISKGFYAPAPVRYLHLHPDQRHLSVYTHDGGYMLLDTEVLLEEANQRKTQGDHHE